MNKIISILLGLMFFIKLATAQLNPIVDSIPMRDGKKLAADIFLPQGTSGSYPVILIQTPYNRLYYRYNLPLGVGQNLSGQPYAFVTVDWRCFYGSANSCVSQPDRGKDGYDIVEWIAAQSWCNGKIGTWGPSALGRVQYWTAKENPPHLSCICPLVASPYYNYEEYYPGGVYRTEYVQQLDNLGFGLSAFLLAHPYYDFTWQYVENANNYPSQIKIPTLMIGGWYDHNVNEMIDFFARLRSLSPINVRDKHRLLMGPWAHGGFGPTQVGTAQQGQLYFYNAAGWSDSIARSFFDYYLRSQNNGWEQQPYVLYYQIGENQWKNTTAWPPSSETTLYNLYLNSDFSLSLPAPTATTGYNEIIYDPRNPSPTVGGPTLRQDLQQGPYDQAPVVESRNDILKYTTPILNENVALKGNPTVKLYISSNRFDTDFAARLTDVYPDGRSMLIVDGIRRVRFRNGFTVNDTSFIEPGEIVEVEIKLPHTAYTFLSGHRIRLDITSSNYPRFDKNLNNGGAMYVAGDTLIANNRVYCNSSYLSRIELPLVSFANLNDKTFVQDDLMLYPNPANNELNIDAGFSVEAIGVFSIEGKEIFTRNVDAKKVALDISQLKQGIYLLKITSKDKIIHHRTFIKTE